MNQSAEKQSRGTILVKALFISYVITGIILLILAFIMYKRISRLRQMSYKTNATLYNPAITKNSPAPVYSEIPST